MGEKREKEFAPVKYYRFPAGVCGAEIRVNIPAIASKSDVMQMAKMLLVAAEEWKELDEEYKL